MTFNVEYDALPDIGHACGHNLIATGSLAAFLASVAALKAHPVPGRVRALGTPAEEGGGGKIKLIDAGAYVGVDACLMTHPMSPAMFPGSSRGIAYTTCVASAKFSARFTGRAAHAAAAPHEGINALDAAVLAYTGIGVLRQQIRPEQRVQVVILQGGDRPNVITPKSVLGMNVRAATVKDARELYARVVKCFEGAAVATGCELEIDECVYWLYIRRDRYTDYSSSNTYEELVSNPSICVAYSEIMAGLGIPQLCNVEGEPEPGPWSTDMGMQPSLFFKLFS